MIVTDGAHSDRISRRPAQGRRPESVDTGGRAPSASPKAEARRQRQGAHPWRRDRQGTRPGGRRTRKAGGAKNVKQIEKALGSAEARGEGRVAPGGRPRGGRDPASPAGRCAGAGRRAPPRPSRTAARRRSRARAAAKPAAAGRRDHRRKPRPTGEALRREARRRDARRREAGREARRREAARPRRPPPRSPPPPKPAAARRRRARSSAPPARDLRPLSEGAASPIYASGRRRLQLRPPPGGRRRRATRSSRSSTSPCCSGLGDTVETTASSRRRIPASSSPSSRGTRRAPGDLGAREIVLRRHASRFGAPPTRRSVVHGARGRDRHPAPRPDARRRGAPEPPRRDRAAGWAMPASRSSTSAAGAPRSSWSIRDRALVPWASPVGCATLTRRLVASDPPTPDEIAALRAPGTVRGRRRAPGAPATILAVGGTSSNLVKIVPAAGRDRALTRRRLLGGIPDAGRGADRRDRGSPRDHRPAGKPAAGRRGDPRGAHGSLRGRAWSPPSRRGSAEGVVLALARAGAGWRDRLDAPCARLERLTGVPQPGARAGRSAPAAATEERSDRERPPTRLRARRRPFRAARRNGGPANGAPRPGHRPAQTRQLPFLEREVRRHRLRLVARQAAGVRHQELARQRDRDVGVVEPAQVVLQDDDPLGSAGPPPAPAPRGRTPARSAATWRRSAAGGWSRCRPSAATRSYARTCS